MGGSMKLFASGRVLKNCEDYVTLVIGHRWEVNLWRKPAKPDLRYFKDIGFFRLEFLNLQILRWGEWWPLRK
jgi:hypothetical protein